MKKFGTKLGTGLAVMSLLGTAFAAPKAKMAKGKTSMPKMGMTKKASGKATQVTGIVTAASATSISLTPAMKKNGANQTFNIPAGAKVTWGKRTITAASITKGQKVTIMMKGGKVTSVDVKTKAEAAGAKGKAKGKTKGGKMSGGKMDIAKNKKM